MGYYTRVLSKDEEFPPFDELAQLVRADHPEYRLTIEEGSEEEWETLLLSGNDEVEVALIERNPVDGWLHRPGRDCGLHRRHSGLQAGERRSMA